MRVLSRDGGALLTDNLARHEGMVVEQWFASPLRKATGAAAESDEPWALAQLLASVKVSVSK
jgi:hypothetical protein